MLPNLPQAGASGGSGHSGQRPKDIISKNRRHALVGQRQKAHIQLLQQQVTDLRSQLAHATGGHASPTSTSASTLNPLAAPFSPMAGHEVGVEVDGPTDEYKPTGATLLDLASMTSQWQCDVESQGHTSQDVMDLQGTAMHFSIGTAGHASPVSSYPSSEAGHSSPDDQKCSK
eukprot:1027647-Karenia_brevis.AAC.1